MTPGALTVLGRLERWGASRDWVGPDPYEGLNTAIGRMARSRRGRQAVIQAYKRARFDPPWPLGAAARPNSKALALALSGYSQPAGASLAGAGEQLRRLPKRIEGLAVAPDAESRAWSYHFSVQTRHLFYSEATPNAIATCFVVEALIEASERLGDERHAELALRARPFLLSLFQRDRGGAGPFFAYIARGSELIHNANLLVCAALARLGRLEPDERAAELVAQAAATTLSAQRADGLWPYGDAPNLTWADNFHTAYVLESLAAIEAAHGLGGEELRAGFEAWRERFIEPDGAARYFPDRRHPLEPHSYASAIDLLCAIASRDDDLGGDPLALADRLAASAIRELWLEDEGRFAFRRGPRGLNRRAFMRWTNAPMFRALSRLASARAGGGA